MRYGVVVEELADEVIAQLPSDEARQEVMALVEVARIDPRAWPDVRDPGSVEESERAVLDPVHTARRSGRGPWHRVGGLSHRGPREPARRLTRQTKGGSSMSPVPRVVTFNTLFGGHTDSGSGPTDRWDGQTKFLRPLRSDVLALQELNFF
ncbi:hypothetical protein ACFT8W_17640 [Streptomyces hygroscopicus]|uniref:hypothetical protein n=1 Tax=Streptomyces hygroscopicus TaxID=1912 RepID=UPI003631F9AB